ncbi:FKBP12-associated protein [Lobaria immixta]|nr:FKBP12-associated protein [Lobaria immixta]
MASADPVSQPISTPSGNSDRSRRWGRSRRNGRPRMNLPEGQGTPAADEGFENQRENGHSAGRRSLAQRPGSVAPPSQQQSAEPSSAEASAAEAGAQLSGRGRSTARRGRGGRARARAGAGEPFGGRDDKVDLVTNTDGDRSRVAGPGHSSTNANGHTSRFNYGRQFGGNLTTPASTDQISHTGSTLQGDAPEFHPGQPHISRFKNIRRAKGSTTPQSSHAKASRLRRDSGLKSTAPDIATRTHEDISNGIYECPICTSEKETFLHLVSGDAPDVIYQKKLFHPHTTAGVRKKPILDQYLVYHLIHVAKLAANLDWCRKNVHIHANSCVTLDRALPVHILVLFRAVFVAKSRFQGDALTLTMTQDGAAERSVEILCLVVNIPVKSLAMKACVALARLGWIADAIVERLSDQLLVSSGKMRS